MQWRMLDSCHERRTAGAVSYNVYRTWHRPNWGALVAEIEEASLEPVRAAGLEIYANMRFGYGIGLAYPPVWLETLQISRGFDDRLEPGMVFVLHAYLQLDHEDLGVIQGRDLCPH